MLKTVTKICNKCGKELDIDMFSKSKECKDGHMNQCKNCRKEYMDKWHKANIEKEKEYKENNKEHIIKYYKSYREQRSEFYKIYNKEYYEANREHKAEYAKAYNLTHRKELADYQKKYRKDNKEMLAFKRHNYYIKNIKHKTEYGKMWQLANADSQKEWHKNYAATHKNECAIRSQKRRTKKRLLPSDLTIEQWEKIKLDFDNKCCYCGNEKPLEQEHFIALDKGGEYTINNIIPACKSCNSGKQNRDFFEWYHQQSFYNKSREQKILKYLNYNKNNIQQLTLAI